MSIWIKASYGFPVNDSGGTSPSHSNVSPPCNIAGYFFTKVSLQKNKGPDDFITKAFDANRAGCVALYIISLLHRLRNPVATAPGSDPLVKAKNLAGFDR